MKDILRRAAVLLVIFVAGIVGTAFLLNSETTDDRSDMNAPVLPELMVDMDGVMTNRMYGYVQEMQADFTRDSITPLDTTKKLNFVVNPYDTGVTSLSYEIRTSDGSKVIENKKIKSLDSDGSYLRTTVEIGSDLLMNQEYSMQITLDTEAGEVYYYTRVISRPNLNTSHYVKFVKSFYETCMNKSAAEDLAAYIEPLENQGTTNYANISINSTLAEITWGDLAPTIARRGVPVIKDINETTASISLDYQITVKNIQGGTGIYDVSEFYRMRYTESRIRLLDFKRSANQIFNPELSVITEEGLILGIRDKDVSYMTNLEGDVAAFVQQGDLWSYSPENGKLVKIFSFRRDENGDFRDSRNAHDIKIIRVQENGDVDFVLYGYMNRGIHEGYSGVCVYHYSSDQNVVEEKVFIPSTESYEFLNEDLGTLSYVSKDNHLFLLFAKKLYQIDIEGGSYKILEEGIQTREFVVSDTNAHAAWRILEGDDKGKIKEIDFDTLSTRMLEPKAGEQLRALGFMNEDLIYGNIMEGDILVDENAHEIEGIHTIKIESFEGEVKKEYHREGLYITSITVEDTMAEFELSAKSGSAYTVQKTDTIMNNKKAAANKISVELVSYARTGTQVRLAFDDGASTDEPLIVRAKMRSVEEHVIVLDTQIPEDETYYVYGGGGLEGVYEKPGEAVRRADEVLGVVLNRNQQYVWERGNKKIKLQLNIEDVPQIMRTGIWDVEKLQEGLGEMGTIIDLSGCTLDSVLYQISAQRPVIAKTGSDSSVVIVGYDEYNTYIYNPANSQVKPYGMNDSTALFEKAGNIFISYIEALDY